jgi:nitrogenase iron protein NifH
VLLPYATSLIQDFAAKTGTSVIGNVPRSMTVAQSELYGQTVIEAAPKSDQAQVYRDLANFIDKNEETVIPKPLNGPELKKWAREWGDRIFEVDAGVVHEMAAI